jgi:cyclic beta-1,2-glucan synthetase
VGARRRASPEKPLRGELLSLERLEERAKSLAAGYTLSRSPRRGARPLVARLEDNARVLRQAYRVMAEDVHRGEPVSPAAEWLLDNFHLIEAESRGVRHDLPQRYYLELPKLATRELAGTARVYAMALELIRQSDSRLDRQRLVRFVAAYQTVAPLTIGELWAWPSMLKVGLIENLRRLAEEILDVRRARSVADRYLLQLDDDEDTDAVPPLPEGLDITTFVRLLQRMREYGPRISPVRVAVEGQLAAQGLTAEDARRTRSRASGSAPPWTGPTSSRP